MPDVIRCAECGTPVAEVQAGALVIRSKHHGNAHVTVLSWERLRQLLEPPEAVRVVITPKP
jgi:hypothetical protein